MFGLKQTTRTNLILGIGTDVSIRLRLDIRKVGIVPLQIVYFG